MKKIITILFISILLFNCHKKEEIKKNTNEIIPENTEKTERETKAVLPEVKEKKEEKISLPENNITVLWSKYNKAKKKVKEAKETGNFKLTIESLLLAAQYAQQLNRDDIVSWQYNNAGYYSIIEFKKRTDYSHKMHKLGMMKAGEEKREYLNETKNSLGTELPLLSDASEYLKIANDFNKKSMDKERTRIIQRNINFINDINKFLE